MNERRVLPAFKSEAEEAEWWYKNRARLDRDIVTSAKSGKLRRLTREKLKERLAASKSRVVSIRLPEDDINLRAARRSKRVFRTRRTSNPSYTKHCGKLSSENARTGTSAVLGPSFRPQEGSAIASG